MSVTCVAARTLQLAMAHHAVNTLLGLPCTTPSLSKNACCAAFPTDTGNGTLPSSSCSAPTDTCVHAITRRRAFRVHCRGPLKEAKWQRQSSEHPASARTDTQGGSCGSEVSCHASAAGSGSAGVSRARSSWDRRGRCRSPGSASACRGAPCPSPAPQQHAPALRPVL